jgi:hypothetical protein
MVGAASASMGVGSHRCVMAFTSIEIAGRISRRRSLIGFTSTLVSADNARL